MTDRDASLREAARLEILHKTSDPYAAAIRATRMPIAISDARIADNPIVFANDAFVGLSGYSRDEIIGRNCRFLQGPDTDRTEVARLSAAIAAGETVAAEILNYRKDGTRFWNALSISPVFDETGAITHFFGSQLDATARNRSANDLRDANAALAEARRSAEALVEARTRDLEAALEQKTQLLHEIDHRVKNNLQLISSLILLQSRRISDPDTRAAMKATLGRVNALATVHRNLFQGSDAAAFDVPAFVRNLAQDLVEAAGRDDLRLEFRMAPLLIPASRAAPVALVVNELLTNAISHAFPDRGGSIRISTETSPAGAAIEVADDGVGHDAAAAGFGSSLIELLTRQLSGRVERSDAAPGFRVRLFVPDGAEAASRPA